MPVGGPRKKSPAPRRRPETAPAFPAPVAQKIGSKMKTRPSVVPGGNSTMYE